MGKWQSWDEKTAIRTGIARKEKKRNLKTWANHAGNCCRSLQGIVLPTADEIASGSLAKESLHFHPTSIMVIQ
jgi:hypothetical protein